MLKYTINNLKLFKSRNTMPPRKLIIFIYLLFKATQPSMASEIFYTNAYEVTYWSGFAHYDNVAIHMVDLSDSSFMKIIENAILHDVKEDNSTILFSPVIDQYSDINEIEAPIIIKDYYNYDTLSIVGHEARFNSDGNKIVFSSSFTGGLYTTERFSSLDIHSTLTNVTTTLSDSIWLGYYILSHDKNRILWTEKISSIDSLNIFIYNIDLDQTNLLNAKLPLSNYGTWYGKNLFWGKNNFLYASLKDTNGVSCLHSLDIDQNTAFFTNIFSFETDLYILNTQDFSKDKFLFSQFISSYYDYGMVSYDSYYHKIWAHNINNGTSDSLFNTSGDYSHGQTPLNYFWSSDTSDIYLGTAENNYMSWHGFFYHFDLPSDMLTRFNAMYRYPLNNSYGYRHDNNLIYFGNNINSVPSNNELIYPNSNAEIELDQFSINDSTTFLWTSSQDSDNDSLSYTFNFWDRDVDPGFMNAQPGFKVFSQNTSDTSITLSNDLIYNIYSEALDDTVSYFRWSVDVTDGLHVLRRDYHNALPIAVNYSLVELSVEESIMPKEFALHQNYPNPFNPSTFLHYDLPEEGLVDITIYDMMGRVVKTLVNGSQTAGFKSIQWNATNDRNEPVSAGLYLYTIQAGEFRQAKKMILLK